MLSESGFALLPLSFERWASFQPSTLEKIAQQLGLPRANLLLEIDEEYDTRMPEPTCSFAWQNLSECPLPSKMATSVDLSYDKGLIHLFDVPVGLVNRQVTPVGSSVPLTLTGWRISVSNLQSSSAQQTKLPAPWDSSWYTPESFLDLSAVPTFIDAICSVGTDEGRRELCLGNVSSGRIRAKAPLRLEDGNLYPANLVCWRPVSPASPASPTKAEPVQQSFSQKMANCFDPEEFGVSDENGKLSIDGIYTEEEAVRLARAVLIAAKQYSPTAVEELVMALRQALSWADDHPAMPNTASVREILDKYNR